MGAEGSQIFLIYLVQIMAVACIGLVLGLVLGAALPFAVEYFFGASIPAPANYAVYPGPLVLAAVFGLLAALGFAIPPLARAREIAPAGLFRDLVAPSQLRARLGYRVAAVAIFAAIAALSVVLSPYPEFNLGFLAGMAAVLVFLRVGGLSRPQTDRAPAAPEIASGAACAGQSGAARRAVDVDHGGAGTWD